MPQIKMKIFYKHISLPSVIIRADRGNAA